MGLCMACRASADNVSGFGIDWHRENLLKKGEVCDLCGHYRPKPRKLRVIKRG